MRTADVIGVLDSRQACLKPGNDLIERVKLTKVAGISISPYSGVGPPVAEFLVGAPRSAVVNEVDDGFSAFLPQ